MDGLYTDIEKKIKALAMTAAIIGCLAAVVGGIWIISIDEDMAIVGILVMIVGAVLSWVSSWLVYGFGELIEETRRNRYINGTILHTMKERIVDTPSGWTCSCGRGHAAYESSCVCGKNKWEAAKKPDAPAQNQTASPKTRETKQEEYVSGRTYFKGDRVSFEGQWYVCTADGDTGCVWSPSQKPSQWQKEKIDDWLGF